MSDLSAEAEIFRENLIEEVTANLQHQPVTPETMKAALLASFETAYARTVEDCVHIQADEQQSRVTIMLPPGLFPER